MTRDRVFNGSIPELYDSFLVPMIFAPYAADIAALASSAQPRQVLEVAAGTGAVTRELARTLPDGTAVVATDLNDAMLDRATATGTVRPVTWRQADVMRLPFDAAAFDVVVCQFGVMFFPDKVAAFEEIRRVLRPGGTFIFNVWDRMEENEFAAVVTSAVSALFPQDPPLFLARTPHGYHDVAHIRDELAAAGFQRPASVSTVAHRSHAESARVPAVAYCEGTPLRNEIEDRRAGALAKATTAATEALARQFGDRHLDGKIHAHVIVIENS